MHNKYPLNFLYKTRIFFLLLYPEKKFGWAISISISTIKQTLQYLVFDLCQIETWQPQKGSLQWLLNHANTEWLTGFFEWLTLNSTKLGWEHENRHRNHPKKQRIYLPVNCLPQVVRATIEGQLIKSGLFFFQTYYHWNVHIPWNQSPRRFWLYGITKNRSIIILAFIHWIQHSRDYNFEK